MKTIIVNFFKSKTNQYLIRLAILFLFSSAAIAEEAPAKTPAPGSKFALLEKGMTRAHVEHLIGKSLDCKIVPMFFSSDIVNCPYEKEGFLIYIERNGLLDKIVVDTSSDGFQPANKN